MPVSVDSLPTFARRLKQARTHAGFSQKEVGIRAGLDPHVASPRINQYERGTHEPKLETAERLAEALGIPAAFLYTQDELLAKVLLRWNGLTKQQKRDVLRLIEPMPVGDTGRATQGVDLSKLGEQLAAQHGLMLQQDCAMPANNRLLVFLR